MEFEFTIPVLRFHPIITVFVIAGTVVAKRKISKHRSQEKPAV